MLISIILIGFLSGCLTMLIYFCIGSPDADEFTDKRIFSFWGKFISSKYKVNEGFWWKPLGGCVYCMGPWVSWLGIGLTHGVLEISGIEWLIYGLFVPAVCNFVLTFKK